MAEAAREARRRPSRREQKRCEKYADTSRFSPARNARGCAAAESCSGCARSERWRGATGNEIAHHRDDPGCAKLAAASERDAGAHTGRRHPHPNRTPCREGSEPACCIGSCYGFADSHPFARREKIEAGTEAGPGQ